MRPGEMVLLLHWSMLNYTAVVKILKKHGESQQRPWHACTAVGVSALRIAHPRAAQCPHRQAVRRRAARAVSGHRAEAGEGSMHA